MLVKIKQKKIRKSNIPCKGAFNIKFTPRGEGVPSKFEHTQIAGSENMLLRMFASRIIFFKQVIVHKLLAIITRFFVGFVKIPALLKISVLKNYISSFCLFYN